MKKEALKKATSPRKDIPDADTDEEPVLNQALME